MCSLTVRLLTLSLFVSVAACSTAQTDVGDASTDAPVASDRADALSPPEDADDTASDDGVGPPNLPPQVQITSPTAASVLQDDAPVDFVATVTDDQDSVSSLVIVLTSSIDGTLPLPPPSATGQLVTELGALSAGSHTIVLAATDSEGLTADAEVSVEVNGSPTSPAVAIEPSAPTTQVDLHVEVTVPSTDPNREASELTYSWTWFRDETLVTDISGSEVLAAETKRGETWRVEVRASDGVRTSAPAAAEVVIENTPPQCGSVTLLPSSGTTETEFVCACNERLDPDGDAPDDACMFYDGINLLQSTESADGICTLPASLTTKNMEVSCVWRAGDDAADGPEQSSSVVLVQNAPPGPPVVTLDPAAATVTDLLTCTVAEEANDLDGDLLSYQTSWHVNGYLNPGSTSASVVAQQLFSDADGAPASKGDVVSCAVVAHDGEAPGAPGQSNAVELGNAPPTGGSAIVSPIAPKEGDTLECLAAEAVDADGDETSWTYEWLVNDEPVPDVSSSTLSSEHFDKGDAVTCVATPTDGTDAGAPVAAKLTVQVQNTPPSLSVATLSPVVVSRLDALTCTFDGWSDPDPVDAIPDVRIDWLVGETGAEPELVVGDGPAELPAWDLIPGTTVWCRVTPLDSDTEGQPVDSNTAVVVNYAPSIDTVSITPEAPLADNVLTCAPAAPEDAEQDPVELGYRWLVGGVSVDGAANSTLSGEFVKGDEVRCAVTPHDPFDSGNEVLSAPVVIGNKAPIILSVSLAPPFGPPCEVRTCSLGDVVDPDPGDPALVSYRWEIDGESLDGDSATLPQANLMPGQEIHCYAVVTDGTIAPDGSQVFSAEVGSNPSAVTNNKPTMDSVTLGQTSAHPGDILTCQPAGFSDPDCSPPPQWHYSWFVGALLAADETGETFDTSDLLLGATVSCKAAPFDGYEEGSGVLSAPVTLTNQPPSAPGLAVTQAADGEALTCTVLTDSVDPDGDPLEWTWTWTVNGDAVDNNTASLAASVTSDCDVVACSASVSDGFTATDSNVAQLALPLGPACDDANLCTDEMCADDGGCLSVPNTAPCPDDDLCNGDEVCGGGECTSGPSVDCAGVASPCLEPVCNPETGGCDLPVAEGTPCDDEDVCNGDETCSEGDCLGGTPLALSDDVDCTVDLCDTTDGVTHEPNHAACELPGQLCVTTWCSPEEGCQAEPIPNCCGDGVLDEGEACDDGNDVGGDGCSPTCTNECFTGVYEGHDYLFCRIDAEWEQAAAACEAHGMSLARLDSAAENDWVAAGAQQLQLDQGTSDSAAWLGASDTASEGQFIWQDGSPLTIDNWFVNATGATEPDGGNSQNCVKMGFLPTLGNPAMPLLGKLMDDTCDSNRAFVCEGPVDGSLCACDDADPCNGAESCYGDVCQPGATVDCSGVTDPCIQPVCNSATGACDLLADDGTPCLDDDLCNGDETCSTGQCVDGDPVDCTGVTDPCLELTCNPASGTCDLAVPDGAPCPDDSLCNGDETCWSGSCEPGVEVTCADIPCIEPACNETTGACDIAVPDDTPCPDDDVCNGPESCSSGSCLLGTPPALSDAVDCTLDACDPVDGVSHTADDSACEVAPGTCGIATCNAETGCVVDVPPTCCGNGVLESDEDCDDGNELAGDGCSPTCTNECFTGVYEGHDYLFCRIDADWEQAAAACEAHGMSLAKLDTAAENDWVAAGGQQLQLDQGTSSVTAWIGATDTATEGQFIWQDGSLVTIDNWFVKASGATEPDGGNAQNCVKMGFLPTLGSPAVPLMGKLMDGVCTAPKAFICESPTEGAVCICDDADPCNGVESCYGEVCQLGSTVDCSGVTDPCIQAVCNPGTGACDLPEPDDTACLDDDVCNGSETCQQGTCTAGTPLDASDAIGCTVDACDPVSGVTHTPDDSACPPQPGGCPEVLCDPTDGCVISDSPTCCGDGIVEGDEQCDDANAEPGDACDHCSANTTCDALEFDGLDDYVLLGAQDNLLSIANAFTVSAWIRWEGGAGCIFDGEASWSGTPSYNAGIRLRVLADGAVAGFFGTGLVPDGPALNTPAGVVTSGAWHHVVFARNGAEAEVYVDGVEQATSTSLGSQNVSYNGGAYEHDEYQLGRCWSTVGPGELFFEGAMRNVGVWARRLTPLEVDALAGGPPPAVVPTDLRGSWALDATSEVCDPAPCPAVLVDGSGSGHHGVPEGPVLTPDSPPGCAHCGNGIVEWGEPCDDGNPFDDDTCDSLCVAACGNGTVETWEECDDGNVTSGDGCTDACSTEPQLGCSALQFDGPEDIVQTSGFDWGPTPVTELTVEAWIRSDTPAQSSFARLAAQHQECWTGKSAFALSVVDGSTLHFHVCTDGGPTSGSWVTHPAEGILSDGSWHHVAVQWVSATVIRMFVDGAMVAELTSNVGTGELRRPPLDLGIGRIPFNQGHAGSQNFIGAIGAVRLSGVERYLDGFTPPTYFSADADTLGVWQFDEGSGEVAADSGPGGQHGAITNATWTFAQLWCNADSCGDLTLDPWEECDDGNLVSGDGCSETCADECFVGVYGGHDYLFCRIDASWEQAAAMCTAQGMSLVKLDTAAENDWVAAGAQQFQLDQGTSDVTAWLGATDTSTEGQFVWQDGTPVTIDNWFVKASGGTEPDGGGAQNCLKMGILPTLGNPAMPLLGTLMDGVCTAHKAFICEDETGGKSCACDDADPCNGAESCYGEVCQPGATVDCSGVSDPCIQSVCNPATGACDLSEPDDTPCLDNDVCNGSESCQLGTCTAGMALELSDEIGCTVDTCDPVDGPTHTPDDSACPPQPGGCPEVLCDPIDGCVISDSPTCCADGIVEGDEQCDDANTDPDDACDHCVANVGCDALQFDGVDDYVLLGAQDNLLSITNAFTVSAWIRWEGDFGCIFDGEASSSGTPTYNAGFRLRVWADGRLEGFYGTGLLADGPVLATVPGAVSAGAWHHVAFTRDGGDGRLYIDGAQEASSTSLGSQNISYNGGAYEHDEYQLGRCWNTVPPSNQHFNGALRDVGVWARQLSALDVASLAAESVPTEFLDQLRGSWGLGSTTEVCDPVPCTDVFEDESSGGNDGVAMDPVLTPDSPPGCAQCGNGIVEPGEPCDDGNAFDDDGCDMLCVSSCGDGTPDPWEECDDGNTAPGDGCASDCTLEPVTTCSALEFDGPTDIVQTSGFDWGPDPVMALTVEAWIRSDTNSQPAYARIAVHHLGCSPGAGSSAFGLDVQSGNLLVFSTCTDGSPYDSAVTYPAASLVSDGAWHHVAAQWISGTSLTIFVDGLQVAQKTAGVGAGGLGRPNLDLGIGRIPFNQGHTGNQNFVGAIGSVHLSRVARYATAFTPPTHAVEDSETLALWQFDEGAGTTATDGAPTGQDATITGATWLNDELWCTPEPACGDGSLDPGEQCDDGNLAADDGCSPTCTTECFTGVYEGHDYRFCRFDADWSAAAAACEAHGMSLAQLETAGEQLWVADGASQLELELGTSDDAVWIGGTDAESEGQFVWQDGSPVTLDDWFGEAEPDGGVAENCLKMGIAQSAGSPAVPLMAKLLDEACETNRAFVCEGQNDGSLCACDDADPCNGVETCLDGLCLPGVEVDCSGVTATCIQTECNPATGACDLAVEDGTSCEDSDLCNGAESCLAGVCEPGAATDCSAVTDPCLEPTCNPATGACDLPVADGVSCDDGDPCNGEETCAAGECEAGTPIECTPLGQDASTPGLTCRQLYDDGHSIGDSTYWVDPDGLGAFEVYCDMTADGGGWMLIAMIHYADQHNINEPQDWFQNGNGPADGALLTNQLLTNTEPSAHAATTFASLIAGSSVVRMEAHRNGQDMVQTRYRQVASSSSFVNWWLPGPSVSEICDDLAMTTGCATTNMEGGLGGGTNIAESWVTRMNNDGSSYASSLYREGWGSYFNNWGHGFKLWLRE